MRVLQRLINCFFQSIHVALNKTIFTLDSLVKNFANRDQLTLLFRSTVCVVSRIEFLEQIVLVFNLLNV